MCSFKKYLHLLHGGHFDFRPPPGISSPGDAFHTPPTHPLEFRNFQIWLGNAYKEQLRQQYCCAILSCESQLFLLFHWETWRLIPYTTKMMPSVTKHRVVFNCFLSVKNIHMSEEGLERNHITLNTTIYCAIPLQLYIQTFVYVRMTTICRVSRAKKI